MNTVTIKHTLLPLALAGALGWAAPLAHAQPGERPGWSRGQSQGQAMQIPTAQVQAALKERGFGEVLGMQPKKHHIEVYTTRDGAPMEVKLNFDGSFHEWEIPKHLRHGSRSMGTPVSDPAALAAEAGYKNARLGEYKRHHVEIFATNARGENVELHMDPSGLIYKEKLVYDWGERLSQGWGRSGGACNRLRH